MSGRPQTGRVGNVCKKDKTENGENAFIKVAEF